MTIIQSALGFLIDVVGLGNATLYTAPNTYLNQQESYVQTSAAMLAATPEIAAEVLLSMAWIESRYYPTAVSRIENGVRITGVPTWNYPPRGAGSFFCGVTQISAGNSWEKCLRARNVFSAYQETIKELKQWMSPKICGHDLRCALTGYSGGFPAIKSGTNNYAAFVFKRAHVIDSIWHRKRAQL